MWNGGKLPWGKPYFQDVRQTMLQSDAGYQQARSWWEQNQELATRNQSRVADLERELRRAHEEYSDLNMRYGSAIDHINRAERIRRVPRSQTDTEPKAGPSAPAAERPERAREGRPVPDASGPANNVGGPQRPASPPHTGLGEGAPPEDEE